MQKPKILVIDDELSILKSIKRVLRNTDCELEIMLDPVKAQSLIEDEKFDIILTDYHMPKLDGVSILTRCKHLHPESMRILMSGKADFDTLSDAINEAGIYRFIAKPFDNYELLFALDQAIENKALHDENTRLAKIINEQKSKLSKQKEELKLFEKLEPGLTKVKRAKDGSIILSQ